jgi:hypothetical protein
MQLASSFCRSYRCKALTRGMRNHWLGSSLDSRVATMRGTPKVAISCRLSVKEVGHSSFRLHPSSFPQAVSSFTFDHAKPRSAHLTPDCDSSFDGSIMFQISYGKKTDPRHRRYCAGLSGRLWTFDRRRPFVLRPPSFRRTPNSASLANRQGFSHREADEKSLLDEAFRREMGERGRANGDR